MPQSKIQSLGDLVSQLDEINWKHRENTDNGEAMYAEMHDLLAPYVTMGTPLAAKPAAVPVPDQGATFDVLVRRIIDTVDKHAAKSREADADEALFTDISGILRAATPIAGTSRGSSDPMVLREARAVAAYYFSARREIRSDPYAAREDHPVPFGHLSTDAMTYWFDLGDLVAQTRVWGGAR